MTAELGDRRILGAANTYDGLMDLLRKRKNELGITFECLDAASGTQPGYSAKICAPVPIRVLGRLSLGLMLQAMGLTLLVCEDRAALEKIRNQLEQRKRPKRDASNAMPAAPRKKRRKFLPFSRSPEFARLMRVQQLANLTPEQRSASARRAARIRWRREHSEKREQKSRDKLSHE
jgi:hypothetical protein